MIDVEVVGNTAVAAKLDAVPKKLRLALTRTFDRIGFELERFVKTQKLSGQSLRVRTGNLRRAIFHQVGQVDDDVFVLVGADLHKAKYARAQELGATIRPKKSRYLTIPIGDAVTGNGVARFTARQLIQSPGSYGYVGSFTRKGVIFGKLADGSIRPLFALKTQVVLKPVGYLSGTVDEKQPWIVDEVNGTLRQVIDDAN